MLETLDLTIIIGGTASAFAVYYLFRVARFRRRRQLRNTAFPEEWIAYIAKNFRQYIFMSQELKDELHGHVNVFLDEKYFEGCNGLEMTDEIKVTIAAEACILLLNKKDCAYYPGLRTILVYPDPYVADICANFGGQIVHDENELLGESTLQGVVIVCWSNVVGGGADSEEGNVVIHEFAHQLDQEKGFASGMPLLQKGIDPRQWQMIFSRNYESLRKKARRGRHDIIDDYGATNPAEFFAVATETFFDYPRQLLAQHPDLYMELKAYYRLDPVTWGAV
ncbi:MAG: hypothetical protein A2020_08005 [Lentisphaerae bacterium GWF2_45_14]|nr:MAG: hypothetical protein A2020_08005 [Lentisphaerae bacterium GWF2_45_14]